MANAFALLERGRTAGGGRAELSFASEVPEAILRDLVHRVDITRMPFVRGRMVRQLWSLGYKSLQTLREAHSDKYLWRICGYYADRVTKRRFDAAPKRARGLVRATQDLRAIVDE